jgi:hypothetical protein
MYNTCSGDPANYRNPATKHMRMGMRSFVDMIQDKMNRDKLINVERVMVVLRNTATLLSPIAHYIFSYITHSFPQKTSCKSLHFP